MSDQFSELKSRLVVGRKRDGRCVYDEIAKSELIALCQRPGVSVARVARECGVNANQVSRWLREHGRVKSTSKEGGAMQAIPASASMAFVELPMPGASASLAKRPSIPLAPLDMQARLPNGVVLDLRGLGAAQVGELIQALGRLACSASTKD